MKLLLKIVAIPIVVVLTLFVWVCSALLYCSAFLLGLVGTVLGFFGVLALITGSTTNGIIVLVMAFLVSPVGLPMVAAWILEKYKICDTAYKTGCMGNWENEKSDALWHRIFMAPSYFLQKAKI